MHKCIMHIPSNGVLQGLRILKVLNCCVYSIYMRFSKNTKKNSTVLLLHLHFPLNIQLNNDLKVKPYNKS